MKDAAAIVGIAETPFAKQLAESEKQLAINAILGALEDAGIDASEVDGLASYTLETTDEVEIAKNVGMGDITYFSQVGYGGGAGPACVGQLAMAVATGQCRVGIAWRSRKRGSGPRPWTGAAQASVPGTWTRPFGLLRPVDESSLYFKGSWFRRRLWWCAAVLAIRRDEAQKQSSFTFGVGWSHGSQWTALGG